MDIHIPKHSGLALPRKSVSLLLSNTNTPTHLISPSLLSVSQYSSLHLSLTHTVSQTSVCLLLIRPGSRHRKYPLRPPDSLYPENMWREEGSTPNQQALQLNTQPALYSKSWREEKAYLIGWLYHRKILFMFNHWQSKEQFMCLSNLKRSTCLWNRVEIKLFVEVCGGLKKERSVKSQA